MKKVTLEEIRAARADGRKLAMLTCYDYTTACLMEEVGIPLVLVGDSAANVILGYPTTIPISLDFMIEITRAVRKGAPSAFLVADMPFGSYHASVNSAIRNVCRMMQETASDCVKLEVSPRQTRLVRRLSDAGIAVMAHLGLRPQSVGVLGGYKTQGRTHQALHEIVAQAQSYEAAGAVSVLLEAVPAEVSAAVVTAISIPVIGCGAGPACHGHVVVMHDILQLSAHPPKFAPPLVDVGHAIKQAFQKYKDIVEKQTYPGPEHGYSMAVPRGV